MKVLMRLVVALVVMAGAGTAADDESSRRSLKGLNGVSVFVEDLKADVERDGLTKTAIQTDVELKLRQAGIPVLGIFAKPCLHINVNMLCRNDLYAYALSVEILQPVHLVRDPSIFCDLVVTWSLDSVGMVSPNNIRTVRDLIKDEVDQFINAYLSVNPK